MEHKQMEQEGWVTLADAAKALDCSIDTVRRRLRRGEIQGQLKSTRHGKVWLVCISSLGSISTDVQKEPMQPRHDRQEATELAQPSAQADDQVEKDQGIVELVKLVAKLQEENRNLAGQLGFNQSQLMQAQERILALEAPKVVDVESESREESLPRWRRWLGTLGYEW